MSTDLPDIGSPPTIHYSGDHLPNQHADGAHITPPVSHVDDIYGHTTHLDWAIYATENLKYTARFWRSDATWPKLREILEWHEAQLAEALRRDPESRSIQKYLRKVRSLLGPRLVARFVRFLKRFS